MGTSTWTAQELATIQSSQSGCGIFGQQTRHLAHKIAGPDKLLHIVGIGEHEMNATHWQLGQTGKVGLHHIGVIVLKLHAHHKHGDAEVANVATGGGQPENETGLFTSVTTVEFTEARSGTTSVILTLYCTVIFVMTCYHLTDSDIVLRKWNECTKLTTSPSMSGRWVRPTGQGLWASSVLVGKSPWQTMSTLHRCWCA